MGTCIIWKRRFFAGVALFLLAGTFASAQQPSERKIKNKVNPAYPDLARRMNISGKVKIEVVIAPDGHIKSSRAVGGHPLLVQPCVDALKDWRFDTGSEDTTQVIEFNFKD